MVVKREPTVSAIAVVDLADELISRKLIDQTTLKAISSQLDKVYQEHHDNLSIIEKRLPETDLLSLWEIAVSLAPSPALGFDIGESVKENSKGLLANWLSCCDTLKQALTVFHENLALLNEAESWSIKQEPEHIKLSFNFNSKYAYPQMAIERSMVALIAWAEHFTSSTLNIHTAKFVFTEPEYCHRYHGVFGSNLTFNANENSIEILKTELNKTIRSSNPYLRELIAERSENIPFQKENPASMQTKVDSLLKADLMTYCHLDAQLGRLHMSKAKLYRKLKEEGTTFSNLVLNERIRVLTKLQKQYKHYSNEQSAEALGFKDVSSFYKFLKKQYPQK